MTSCPKVTVVFTVELKELSCSFVTVVVVVEPALTIEPRC